MRKQYFYWIILVFAIVATIYGAYGLIYNYNHGKGLSVYALVMLVAGVIALVFFLATYIPLYVVSKRKKEEKMIIEEKPQEEEAPVVKEDKPAPPVTPEPKLEPVKKEYTPREQKAYSSSSSYSSIVYVKQVGHGPLLRINGERILDMRSNTYYRLENNRLMQEGYGPVYEIRGNQIKDAFGGYLYEISGSNINKVFGGFYASISGNYITLFDLSIKYEMTDSLSKNQLLAAAALLFGKY